MVEPQRDSNPCYRLERAASWATRRWGPRNLLWSCAGVPGLEPRLTEPESVGLPITPYPKADPTGCAYRLSGQRRTLPEPGSAFQSPSDVPGRGALSAAVPSHRIPAQAGGKLVHRP